MERPRWLTRRLFLNPFIWACAGVIVGSGVSWYLTRPWLEFEWLTASYERGAERITLLGEIRVNRSCPPEDVIWRTEALANDGQVASYAPTEQAPVLTKGLHQYEGEIALKEPILPDSWQVTIIVSCAGDGFGTAASKRTLVTERGPAP